MIVYKLFREMKDGNLSSLFINKKARYKLGQWMDAENHPTKGYANRFGWHSCNKPIAPHLSTKNRNWYKCEIKDYVEIKRPISQGGKWFISKKIKILEKL